MDRCIPEGPPHARNQILNTMALTMAFWTIRQIGRKLSTDLTRMAETGHVVAQVTPGEWGFVPTWLLSSHRLRMEPAAAANMPGSRRNQCPHHPQSMSDY